ncbi:MAG: hypothetical protein JWN04_6011 [Myxococcaceae bacterium]|nr:hypothetical protein [Myxococcaceae bacterium]
MLRRPVKNLLALTALLFVAGPQLAQAQLSYLPVTYPDPEALLNAPPKTVDNWTFVPIAGAKCRHGSDTGIAVRMVAGATKLMITVQGGGACFSGASCAVNLGDYAEGDFENAAKAGNFDRGVFDQTPSLQNEVGSYSQVFIPYCTGDLFVGDKVTTVPGVQGVQSFVGYKDMELYFNYIAKRLVPMLGERPEVKLSGLSAGGYGALLNASRLRTALPASVPLSVLDDSAPPFDSTLFLGCQQQRWSDTWGLQNTVVRDCGPSCSTSNWMNPAFVQLLNTQPNVGFALASRSDDQVIQAFSYLFTSLWCAKDPTEAEYTAGLLRIRSQLNASRPNNGATYFVRGTDHCFLNDHRYYDSSVNGYTLKGWAEGQFDHSTSTAFRPAYYFNAGP